MELRLGLRARTTKDLAGFSFSREEPERIRNT
jgi:hypothetical protein